MSAEERMARDEEVVTVVEYTITLTDWDDWLAEECVRSLDGLPEVLYRAPLPRGGSDDAFRDACNDALDRCMLMAETDYGSFLPWRLDRSGDEFSTGLLERVPGQGMPLPAEPW